MMPLEMIQAISGHFYNKIASILLPLESYGISYFCWQTISNDGKWSIIGNRPDWLEHCAYHHYYLNDPSLIHPKFYNSSIHYTAIHQEDCFQNTIIKDAADLFDLNYGLVMIEKHAQSAEFTIFAAPNKHQHMINTYLNYLPQLKKFVIYFKQEMAPIIDAMRDINVDLTQLNNNFFCGEHKLVANTITATHSILANTILTKREQECLHYTLQGMTAKEIARVLQLSHRTVEIHLANLRKKYGLNYKRTLFSIESLL